MGTVHAPQLVKLIMGLIATRKELLDQVCQQLSCQWGELESVSPIYSFSHTDYYRAEMGADLIRQFVSFKTLIESPRIASYKLLSNQIETEFADRAGSRQINLDPGYLNEYQLVLASTKNFAHRIYMRDGIYVELTLQYKKGVGWQDLPWTYPDYKSEPVKQFFLDVRKQYRQQLSSA